MIKKMLVEKLKKEKENAIILMHDIHSETATGTKHVFGKLCITGQSDKHGLPITVKNLLEQISDVDDKERIYLNEDGEELLYVLSITENDNIVWLETESDNDMREVLSAMFKSFALENTDIIDELVAYSDMLDQGISVEMVRKYLGDDQADHMKEFCVEHGLLNEDETDRESSRVFKVRLKHTVELFVRGNSEEEVQDWLNCHTPESVKKLLEENDKYVDEDYTETILCECESNSEEDITI